MPGQLIVYSGDALCCGRDVAGMLGVLGRLDHTAQTDLAVIAIDRDWIAVGDAVIGKSVLDLGYQQSVVRTFSRGVVMMVCRHADRVVPAKRGVRVGGSRLRADVAGIGSKQSAANQ